MSALVIAEHEAGQLKPSTLNTVSAALLVSHEVHVLVAGAGCAAVAQAAAGIAGVSRVLYAEAEHFAAQTAENIAEQVLALAASYSHILAPATAFGKNLSPRIAARLDVAQISDITAVHSPDAFTRPIYAGNAIAT
ncbi:MAG: electron transfer flavoprotein subunit alpha/FixB family protein, partial [Betaproteobacteria bacterium]|nr:electron transfer flavoprotein subunit alpha/FixB family protein [Betaproteobacteria bacterium]